MGVHWLGGRGLEYPIRSKSRESPGFRSVINSSIDSISPSIINPIEGIIIPVGSIHSHYSIRTLGLSSNPSITSFDHSIPSIDHSIDSIAHYSNNSNNNSSSSIRIAHHHQQHQLIRSRSSNYSRSSENHQSTSTHSSDLNLTSINSSSNNAIIHHPSHHPLVSIDPPSPLTPHPPRA